MKVKDIQFVNDIALDPKVEIDNPSDNTWTDRIPVLLRIITAQRDAQAYLRINRFVIQAEADELHRLMIGRSVLPIAIGLFIYFFMFWLIIGQHWLAPIAVPSRIAIAQAEEARLVSFTNNIEEAELAKWYLDPNQMAPNMPITVTAGYNEPAFGEQITCQDASQIKIDGKQIPRVSYRFLENGIVFHKIVPEDFDERRIDSSVDQPIWVVIEAKAGTELSGPGRSLYNNTLLGICTSVKLFWDEDHRGPNTLLKKVDDYNWSIETLYEQEGEDIAPKYRRRDVLPRQQFAP